MKDVPMFNEAFAWFHADTYFGVLMCVMVGCLLTFLVQSSSATLAITISLTATGVIPFPTAAALVPGENAGTTITAWLASLGANTSAKRAAYAHILFNLIGVLWITAVFRWYILLIAMIVHSVHGTEIMSARLADFENPLVFGALMTAGIATVHTGFNVANTLIFLPFVPKFTRLLEWLIPDKGMKEIPHLRHLDARMVDTPALGIENSRNEVINMGRGVLKMMDWTKQAVFNDHVNQALVKKTFHREEIFDNVEREIVAFMTRLLDGNVPYAVAEEGRQQLRIAHEYESISDSIASILKGHLRLREEKLDLMPQQKLDLNDLHDSVNEYLRMVVEAFEQNRPDVLTRATSMSTQITRRVKDLRDRLLERLTETDIDPRLSLTYSSLLTNYRRVKEHALNVAEALAGAKAQPIVGA
jgi:phosphate:Na+ symporter